MTRPAPQMRLGPFTRSASAPTAAAAAAQPAECASLWRGARRTRERACRFAGCRRACVRPYVRATTQCLLGLASSPGSSLSTKTRQVRFPHPLGEARRRWEQRVGETGALTSLTPQANRRRPRAGREESELAARERARPSNYGKRSTMAAIRSVARHTLRGEGRREGKVGRGRSPDRSGMPPPAPHNTRVGSGIP